MSLVGKLENSKFMFGDTELVQKEYSILSVWKALLIKPYVHSNRNVNDRVMIKISGVPVDILQVNK